MGETAKANRISLRDYRRVPFFSNRTDSGTRIPFLNYIQGMQGQSYRSIVAVAGCESVGNYLYLEAHGQIRFIKPTNKETRKTKKYREQIRRVENMKYLPHEDCYRCAAGRKLFFRRSCTERRNGSFTTDGYCRCESCAGGLL